MTEPSYSDLLEYYNYLIDRGKDPKLYAWDFHKTNSALQGQNTKLVVNLDNSGRAISFMWMPPEVEQYSENYIVFT